MATTGGTDRGNSLENRHIHIMDMNLDLDLDRILLLMCPVYFLLPQ